MTWNSHRIWYQLGPNCRRFVTWHYMEFPRESMSHFLQRQRNMEKDTLITSFARDQCFFHVICITGKPKFLSFRTITFSAFAIFKIRLQIQIQHEILMYKHVPYDFWWKNSKFSSFPAIKCSNFKIFKIWLHFRSQREI